MKVSQLMSKKLIKVAPDGSVEEAIKRLRRRGVRHLLVMEDSKLVGILSDRDIKRALHPDKMKKHLQLVGGFYFLLQPIKVAEILTLRPVTVGPGTPVHEAARTMLVEKFGALPVVDRKRVVGIVTETDLLQYYTDREAKAEQKAARATSPKRKTIRRHKL